MPDRVLDCSQHSRGPKGPRSFLADRAWTLGRLASVFVVSCTVIAEARSIDVVPADTRDALGAALSTAQPGDTLWLSPGVYPGTHMLKRGVSVIGRAGPDSTILDAAGERWVLTGFDLDPTSTIAGLTIRGGKRDHPNSAGGGLHLRGSSPIVIGNVFEEHLGYLGGGIHAFQGSRPVVAFNLFRRCEGYLGGAVAAYLDADLLLYNNLFVDNVGVSGGAILAMRSAPVLIANTVARNRAGPTGGSAIYLDGAPAWIERNLLAGNHGSAAVYCLTTENFPTLRNNVVSNREGAAGGACPDFTGEEGNCTAEVDVEGLSTRELFDRAREKHCASNAGARAASSRIPSVPRDILDRWREWVAANARDPAAAQGFPVVAGDGSDRSNSSKIRNSTR